MVFCRFLSLSICTSNTMTARMTDVGTGVPKGFILGTLLFLIYVNNLQFNDHVLGPIMVLKGGFESIRVTLILVRLGVE